MKNLRIIKSKSFIKFIFFGTLLTLLSNILLLLLLFIFPVGLATFINQTLYAYFGYLANKYGVFRRKGKPIAYSLLVILSWFIHWFLIKTISSLGFSSTIAVVISIPFMATFSFLSQKFIIFK
tara:strand:- start:289 stop:657 length:369 start_codon:yes stop_codon:yes gene_type:complete